MPIDVANHLWVTVCGAAFATQYDDHVKFMSERPPLPTRVAMMEVARQVADAAVEAFDTLNRIENKAVPS